MQKLLADLSLAIAVNDTGFEQGIFGFEKIDFPLVDAKRLRDLVLPGNGSFSFMYSEENIDGAVLRVETDVPDELELRVAVVNGAGPTRIDSTLTGPVTAIELGSWPNGETTLWVTAANASADVQEAKLSIVREEE